MAAVIELYADPGRELPPTTTLPNGQIVWSDALIELPGDRVAAGVVGRIERAGEMTSARRGVVDYAARRVGGET